MVGGAYAANNCSYGSNHEFLHFLFPLFCGVGLVGPFPDPSAFLNYCGHSVAVIQVHFRWLTCCPLARSSQLSLCPSLLTKARTPRPNPLPHSRTPILYHILRLGRKGGAEKIFKGIKYPLNCVRPLILLGPLYAYMHAHPSDDKKISKIFSCISCISWFPPSPQNTRNRSAEDDASVRATSLTIRLYARDDGR